MSTTPSDMIQVLSSTYQEDLLEISAIALITYEYLITLDQEVTLFWRPQMTGATVLFFGTRYIGLLAYSFLGAATYAPMTDTSCTGIVTAQLSVAIVQYMFWAAFSALRTLALSKMNYTLALATFIFALGPFVINLRNIPHSLVETNVQPFGCGGGVELTPAVLTMGLVVSRSCAIIADTIAITVTWRSTMAAREALTGGSQSSIGSTLLVNGTIYFLVLVTLNVLHLTLSLLSIGTSLAPFSLVTVFTDPLIAILTSRFLLALQAANQQALGRDLADADEHGDRGHGSTLHFASAVLGSISASIPVRRGASALDGEDGEGAWVVDESVSGAGEA